MAANEGAQKALKAVGVDPDTVLKRGLTREGYLEIQYNSNGYKKYYSDGEVVTRFVPWPTQPDPWDILEGLDL